VVAAREHGYPRWPIQPPGAQGKHDRQATLKENANHLHALRWTDGTYSIAEVAAVIGVANDTVYKGLPQGRLQNQQSAKGMPWKLLLTEKEIVSLQQYVKPLQRSKRSKTEAV
jgi:transposase